MSEKREEDRVGIIHKTARIAKPMLLTSYREEGLLRELK